MGRRDFSLPTSIIPRDYQDNAVSVMSEKVQCDPRTWHLFSSPTGTGKSIVELKYLSDNPDSIMITPRIEIITGMLDKMGERTDGLNDIQVTNLAWQKYGIITPIRLRNILARGDMDFMPSSLLIDECHHDTAATYQDITMYLNGCPKVGLTATPYRGTPKQTKEFLRQWGDTVNQILSLTDAVEMGFYEVPHCEVWPLVDDDTIDVSAGDFRVSHVEKKLHDSYQLIVENCKKFYDFGQRCWDMPTIFSLPGTESVNTLHRCFREAGIPTTYVTQATSRLDRIKAFDQCVSNQAALLQINVVSEGVDLPIRRVIDCSPTMSPVRWFQQVGRIRPMKVLGRDAFQRPHYICCCRNLERHCYLFEGLLPNTTIQEAQSAFTDENGVPLFSKRSGTRCRSRGIRPIHYNTCSLAERNDWIHVQSSTHCEQHAHRVSSVRASG